MLSRRGARAARALLLLGFGLAPPLPAQVLECVLAVVGGTPVLLSEVALLEHLRGVSRDAALEMAIDQRLMLAEAQRVAVTHATAEEQQRAYDSLLARFPAAADEPEAELRRLAARELRVLRYVEHRFLPLVRVDETELHGSWEAEHPGAAPPTQAELEALRVRLEARALDAKLEAWVEELRAGTEIRYNR